MNVVKDCLILNLQVGTWMGHKLDRNISRKITDDAGAVEDAGRFNKHIIPKECLKNVTTKVGRVRSLFYDSTMAWKENGDRLLPRNIFMPFIEKFEAAKAEHDEAAEQFVTVEYPIARAQAEFRMGDLFNPNDYPTPDQLRRKFYVNLDVDAVSTAYDARLDERADILTDRIAKAVQSLWARLLAPLEKFGDKMNSDEIFRDSLIGNLREVAAMIPDLNLTDDPALEAIRVKIENELAAYDPADIRKNPQLRKGLGSEAEAIIEQMRGFMSAFSQDENV